MESLRLRRQLGDHLREAIELSNLGDLTRAAGQVDACADFLLRALEIAVELDSRYLLPGLVASLSVQAGEGGDLERATRLLGASQAQYEATGLVPDPVDSVDPDRMRELVLEKLGADRFQTLSDEGRRMSLDQTVAEARAAAG